MIDIVTTLREKVVRAYSMWLATPFQHYADHGVGIAQMYEHYINTGENLYVKRREEERKGEKQ